MTEVATSNGRGASPRSAKRRVGLLGTGYIAEWHAKALATVPGVELVAVCDKVVSRAQSFAEKFRVPAAHGSLSEMLERGGLDAVHVLVPPDLHFESAQAILRAGVHALLEKPMSPRAEDCDALVRLAGEKKLSLGIGHNFLFSDCYERLREDVRSGLLGPLDHVTITWHRELPQLTFGPFDIWMLRDPGNIALEIGSHGVAQVLDLVGEPDDIQVKATNPIALETGRTFYRRWQIDAAKGATAVELRLSFVPGFSEYSVHVRGVLGSAFVDFDRNTYSLRRHHACGDDFDRHAMVADEARGLRRQARRTLLDYVGSKAHLCKRGNPFGASIAKVMDAFYGSLGRDLDERIRGEAGRNVIRVCERIARSVPRPAVSEPRAESAPTSEPAARILVLGATGFIGRELVRQLADAGHSVRVLVRSPGKLPNDLKIPRVERVAGDLDDADAVRKALSGIECVYHLARANVKTWPDYQRYEIDATRNLAELALAAGVKRFIYTGTIDSYYAGAHAGRITEDTPLDPAIRRRNLYARAKAASEEILLEMRRTRGLPLVVFRPGIVIGRAGSPFHWGVGMWWHGSYCLVWGDGQNKLPLVLVDDVARALVAGLDAPSIEGESFNLVGDPCLTAWEYLDELDRCAGMRIQRRATPIWSFYLKDMLKWFAKVAVRHPERRLPSYRDWESRTQRAVFDCSRAKARLSWKPESDRRELVRRGIEEPVRAFLR